MAFIALLWFFWLKRIFIGIFMMINLFLFYWRSLLEFFKDSLGNLELLFFGVIFEMLGIISESFLKALSKSWKFSRKVFKKFHWRSWNFLRNSIKSLLEPKRRFLKLFKSFFLELFKSFLFELFIRFSMERFKIFSLELFFEDF